MRRATIALVMAVSVLPASSAGARSPFAWRGVVEGAYGTPWTHPERTRMLHWLAGEGFNAYVHAPKNDLYGRTQWRDAYPAAQQHEFDAEVRLARRLGMQWIPDISPALPEIPTPAPPDGAPSRDLCFSCASDVNAVVSKFAPFARAGARTFMVSFDDVAKTFTHPEDVGRYGAGDEAFGAACGDFLSRLRRALRARWRGARLLTVGADYSGTGDTAFLQGFRHTLARGIEVMWTGVGVPSKPFAAADARAYAKWIGRVPLVWDNWTDDDATGNAIPFGTSRIFLGPYVRKPSVARFVRGFFLNPANEPDLNLLPLATAAAWLRAPARYRARPVWLAEVRRLAGRSARRRAVLRAWAETSYSTKLTPAAEAPTFSRLARGFLRAYRAPAGRWPAARAALGRELGLVVAAPAELARLPDRRIAVQAARFLASAHDGAQAGLRGLALLAAERPSLLVRRAGRGWAGEAAPPDPAAAGSAREAEAAAARSWQANPRQTYGWHGGIGIDVPPYSAPENVMDTFLGDVESQDQQWQPQAVAAASSVTVALAGRPVKLDANGRFRLPASARGRELVATDGAGGRTALRLR